MILLDSSAWFEIFTNGPKAKEFAAYLAHKTRLIISAVSIFEIYRKLAKSSEEEALAAVAVMQQIQVIPMDEVLCLEAGELAIKHSLAMADSFILATARLHNAQVITKDNDFRGIPGCVVI